MAFCIAAPTGRHHRRRARAPCATTCSAQRPLYVREANPNGKRTVLLLPDFLTDGRLFARLVREPVMADTRLVAVDLRGHGRSPIPEAPYSHAKDMRTVANMCGEDAVHLVGAGLGGIHALEAAVGVGNDGWIRSVALLASGLPGHAWRKEAFLNVTAARRSGDGEDDEDVSETARWVRKFIGANEAWGEVLKHSDASVVAKLKDMVKEYSGYHFRERDLEIRPGNGVPLSERLHQVTVPVLAAVGERDTKDFKDIAHEILGGVKVPFRQSPYFVPAAAHFPTLENPAECSRVLIEFWNSLETGEMTHQGDHLKVASE